MPRAPELDDITTPLIGIVEHEAHGFDRHPEIVSAEAEQLLFAARPDLNPDEIAVHFRDRRLVHILDTHSTPEDSLSRTPKWVTRLNETLPGATNFC